MSIRHRAADKINVFLKFSDQFLIKIISTHTYLSQQPLLHRGNSTQTHTPVVELPWPTSLVYLPPDKRACLLEWQRVPVLVVCVISVKFGIRKLIKKAGEKKKQREALRLVLLLHSYVQIPRYIVRCPLTACACGSKAGAHSDSPGRACGTVPGG